jgi:hypothetical protein
MERRTWTIGRWSSVMVHASLAGRRACLQRRKTGFLREARSFKLRGLVGRGFVAALFSFGNRDDESKPLSRFAALGRIDLLYREGDC